MQPIGDAAGSTSEQDTDGRLSVASDGTIRQGDAEETESLFRQDPLANDQSSQTTIYVRASALGRRVLERMGFAPRTDSQTPTQAGWPRDSYQQVATDNEQPTGTEDTADSRSSGSVGNDPNACLEYLKVIGTVVGGIAAMGVVVVGGSELQYRLSRQHALEAVEALKEGGGQAYRCYTDESHGVKTYTVDGEPVLWVQAYCTQDGDSEKRRATQLTVAPTLPFNEEGTDADTAN